MFSVEFSVSVKFCLTKAKTFRIIKSEFHIHSNASKLHMQESPSGMASASQADLDGGVRSHRAVCGEGTPVSNGRRTFQNFTCRNRLAVWRQLPKLIPAGSTPVSCSTTKKAALLKCCFFVTINLYASFTKCCVEENKAENSFVSPPRETVNKTVSFFRTFMRKSLSLCMRVMDTVRSSCGALCPSR